MSEWPELLVDRLEHYFSTYKRAPGGESQVSIERVLDSAYALRVVAVAMDDNDETYGGWAVWSGSGGSR